MSLTCDNLLVQARYTFLLYIFLSYYSDNTPPTVKNCPKDIIKTTDRLAEVISWTEPLFTDNVAIRHIMYPVRKSGESWYPGEDILMQYIATDIAGNQVKCSFKVSLKCKYSTKISFITKCIQYILEYINLGFHLPSLKKRLDKTVTSEKF